MAGWGTYERGPRIIPTWSVLTPADCERIHGGYLTWPGHEGQWVRHPLVAEWQAADLGDWPAAAAHKVAARKGVILDIRKTFPLMSKEQYLHIAQPGIGVKKLYLYMNQQVREEFSAFDAELGVMPDTPAPKLPPQVPVAWSDVAKGRMLTRGMRAVYNEIACEAGWPSRIIYDPETQIRDFLARHSDEDLNNIQGIGPAVRGALREWQHGVQKPSGYAKVLLGQD